MARSGQIVGIFCLFYLFASIKKNEFLMKICISSSLFPRFAIWWSAALVPRSSRWCECPKESTGLETLRFSSLSGYVDYK